MLTVGLTGIVPHGYGVLASGYGVLQEAFVDPRSVGILGLLVVASAANAGPGLVAAMTKSTWSNAAAIASFASMRSSSATDAVPQTRRTVLRFPTRVAPGPANAAGDCT